MVPLKLKETKRFKDRKVVGLEIGGQMAFILAVSKPNTSAPPAAVVSNAGRSHSPPEPAPAETSA